jgi:RES domain-containing protein
VRFVGIVYRAHNPRWSFSPLSGAGAALHGGRFNRPGREALYVSTALETAIREAAHRLSGKLDPLTLVSYEADIADVVDLTSPASRRAAGVSEDIVAEGWKLKIARGLPVLGWQLAERFVAEGASGILVPSFAHGAGADSINLVLWRWGPDVPHKIHVYDPDQRLPKDQSSWR